jgi:hypothetical protein
MYKIKRVAVLIGVALVVIGGSVIFHNYAKYKYSSVDTSRSSFITSAEYNAYFEHLVLGLNNKRYDYCGIPKTVWSDFIEAESLGSYYNQQIEGDYQCDWQEREDGADPICMSLVVAVSNKWTEDLEYAREVSDSKLEQKQTDFYFDCTENRL